MKRLRHVLSAIGMLLAISSSAGEDVPAKGRAIYNARCYFCHGYGGDARTIAADYLRPPPRAFVTADPRRLDRAAMLAAVRDGKPGTAMQRFAGLLTQKEIELVVDFVRETFMIDRAPNTRYHTTENGWSNHERYRAAFPFVRGELATDADEARLTPAQRQGRALFLSACIACHESATDAGRSVVWESRPLSFPRNQYRPGDSGKLDAMSSASPYLRHERAPRKSDFSAVERQGERLFQANCAFCHGADGSGRNWIGSFLEPHPRNLTDPGFMTQMSRGRLAAAIRDGLPGTSMPAWRDVLSSDEIGAVVAYVAAAFHPLSD